MLHHLSRFRLLVLCAAEVQPTSAFFRPDLVIVRCPLWDDDDPVTGGEAKLIGDAARSVAGAVRRGERVLVTCNAGRNRSGIVTATALHFLTGRSGISCVRMVREGRPGALTNPAFVDALVSLKARGRAGYRAGGVALRI